MNSKLTTYCINLKRRTDRKKSMVKEFSKVADVLDAEFIEAIDGKDLYDKPQRYWTTELYACVLSHKKAIQRAKDNKLDMVLICEDDVVFCEDFDVRLTNYFKEVPSDWNMMYLGFFDNSNITGVTPINDKDNIVRLNRNVGAFAYIVNSNMYDIILNEFNKEYDYTDIALAKLQETNNCYCCLPFMVYVTSGYSDLSNGIANYDIQIKKHFKERVL